MKRHEILLLLNYLETNREYMTSLQYEFIDSLKKHYKTTDVLTKMQVEWLYEMKGYIPSMVSEKSVYKSETENYPAQYSSVDYLSRFGI